MELKLKSGNDDEYLGVTTDKKTIELNYYCPNITRPIDKENVETLLRHLWVELSSLGNATFLNKVSYEHTDKDNVHNLTINFDTQVSDWVSTHYRRNQYKFQKVGVVKESKDKPLE
jgi:hypothetical protein